MCALYWPAEQPVLVEGEQDLKSEVSVQSVDLEDLGYTGNFTLGKIGD